MGDGLSEFELIAALRQRIAAAGEPADSSRVVVGSGDDAAVIAPGGSAVISVDAVIEGTHFERSLAPPRAIGHKALAAALSDLAAMGAEPGEAYVQLGLPPDFDHASCLELADGLGALGTRHGVTVAGGDIFRSPALMLALTVVGYVPEPSEAVTRSGARPGDALVVTGELGGASAGLLLLRRPELGRELAEETVGRLRRRQLEPEPRVGAGRALAAAGARAMIDVSDGLGGDTAHIAAASGVGVAIELERLPIETGVREVAAEAGVDALDLAGAGGEDYELVAALPASRIAEARDALHGAGVRLTEIGIVREGAGVELIDPGGVRRPASGFDQLASPQEPPAPG